MTGRGLNSRGHEVSLLASCVVLGSLLLCTSLLRNRAQRDAACQRASKPPRPSFLQLPGSGSEAGEHFHLAPGLPGQVWCGVSGIPCTTQQRVRTMKDTNMWLRTASQLRTSQSSKSEVGKHFPWRVRYYFRLHRAQHRHNCTVLPFQSERSHTLNGWPWLCPNKVIQRDQAGSDPEGHPCTPALDLPIFGGLDSTEWSVLCLLLPPTLPLAENGCQEGPWASAFKWDPKGRAGHDPKAQQDLAITVWSSS